MNKYFCGAILTFALIMSGCGADTTPGGISTLDIEAAIDNPRPFDLGEIAESIEFIPLDDSNKDGLIDGRILGLAESKNGWYVHDGNFRPIKFFDKTGKYVSTRGSIGRGPTEYVAVNGVVADYETGNTYAMAAREIIAYDADGRMTARKDSISSFAMTWFADHLILVNEPHLQMHPAWMQAPTPDANRRTSFLDLYSADLILQGEVKAGAKGTHYITTFDTVNGLIANMKVMGSPYILSNNGSNLLVKEGRSDTVFYFRNERLLEPAFRLDLGRYTPPAEAFGSNPGVDWSRYYRIVNMWKGEKMVIVTAQKALELTPKFIVFDGNDPSEGFLVAGSDSKNGLSVNGVAFTPMYVRDNRLVGWMQAFYIVDAAENITDPQLKALAATLKEESNPVIVVAELKK
jgi:hypothetical protein